MNTRKKRIWSEFDIKLNEQSTTLTAQLHGLACPSCQSRKYVKSGKEKGNQRYTCSSCNKSFRSTTGNTIHHLHLKPKVQQYIDCMNEGLSLRKTATKCDISLQTAFRWRHRFLKAMNNQTMSHTQGNKVLSALVLPFSSKGKSKPQKTQPHITSILQIDTAGRTKIDVLGKFGSEASKITSILKGHTTYKPSRALPNLFKTAPTTCLTKQQSFQTQETTEQIHCWLAKFRGVASRYLSNYWTWFMHITQLDLQISRPILYMHRCF